MVFEASDTHLERLRHLNFNGLCGVGAPYAFVARCEQHYASVLALGTLRIPFYASDPRDADFLDTSASAARSGPAGGRDGTLTDSVV